MPSYVYVYVGKAARLNFDIGMSNLTWGWKKDSHGPDVDAAMAVLRDPAPDSRVVFAQELRAPEQPAGWPRTPGDDPAWTKAWLEGITLARVTAPLREESEQLWPDALYPYRISLGEVVELPVFAPGDLDPGVVAVIRNAVFRSGLPVLGPPPVPPDVFSLDEIVDDEPDDLSGMEDLDRKTVVRVRREQEMLRKVVFGKAKTLRCSLCHREFPVPLLRLAHIKRRAEATSRERLQVANTMPACTLGCDELFERGYIVVDGQGMIRRNSKIPDLTADLDGALTRFDGLGVVGYGEGSAPFFAAHADRHSRVGVDESVLG